MWKDHIFKKEDNKKSAHGERRGVGLVNVWKKGG